MHGASIEQIGTSFQRLTLFDHCVGQILCGYVLLLLAFAKLLDLWIFSLSLVLSQESL
jgi:hypothetical protein